MNRIAVREELLTIAPPGGDWDVITGRTACVDKKTVLRLRSICAWNSDGGIVAGSPGAVIPTWGLVSKN